MSDEFELSVAAAQAGPEASQADTAKKRQILDGARKVFLGDGFDGASMNEIARAAGVPKGTLYVYFPSKEALFEELVRVDRRQQAEQLFEIPDDGQDVQSVLQGLGENLLAHMASPESLAQVRTIIGISGKLPQIGRAFYEAGPAYGIDKLSRYFDRKIREGVLDIDDTRFAAILFVDLCQSGAVKAQLFGVEAPLDALAIRRNAERASRFFVSVYGRAKHPALHGAA